MHQQGFPRAQIGPVAEGLLGRTPHGPKDAQYLAMTRIFVLRAEGNHAAALAEAKAGGARFSELLGATHPNTLVMLSFQALQESVFEQYDDARTHYQVLYEGFRTQLGVEPDPETEGSGILGRLDITWVESPPATCAPVCGGARPA